MFGMFSKGESSQKDANVVDCDDAKELLLARTGLRIVCPDDDDAQTDNYDNFVRKAEQDLERETSKKDAEVVDCDDAKELLLARTGLRIVCPDDDDAHIDNYDEFVHETEQNYAEKLLKKHPEVKTCEDAQKIVHEKTGIQYVCPDDMEKPKA